MQDAGRVLTTEVAPPRVIRSRAPDMRVMRRFNPLVVAVLRSPWHSVLSSQLLLLTCTGRRSGRTFTLPVGYIRDGDALLVVCQHAHQKQWWRNLLGGARVVVRLCGHDVATRAEAIEDPHAVAAALQRLIDRLGPKQASARLYMSLEDAQQLTTEQFADALGNVVLVRLSAASGS